MISMGLARRLTGLSVGLTMAATMATGLLAAPAAAAATTAAKTATTTATTAKTARPKISVATPKASPKDFEGGCPVKVTFSSKVKVQPTSSRTRVVYRWLHGDGSKSKVKSYTLKGKRAKWITFKEKATFAEDTRDWQALQILSPRKVTSKKGYFSVDCERQILIEAPHSSSWVKAAVEVDRYTESCSSRVDAVGRISVGRPSWVKYLWVRNGRVVDSGNVKVRDDVKVHYSFAPGGSHKGWVALKIVSPRHASSDRAYYEVRCESDAKPSAQVSAPAAYQGTCPVARRFTGIVDAHGAGTTVKYRWAGPGYRGPVASLYFPRHSAPQSVNHTVTASETGKVKRWIEIVSPNHATSNAASTEVTCAAAPVKASITSLSTAPDNATCAQGSSPEVKISAEITVTGPATVNYHWVINDDPAEYPGTVTADKAGVYPVTAAIAPLSAPTAAGKITLKITSPNAAVATKAFSYTCPTS